jgi:glycosyltransferase involved in cell wall biosynthesis
VEPAEVLAAADVLVAQPFYDVRSEAVLQALALGLPIVATHLVRHADLMHTDVTGFLVPSFRPAVLAERLTWLLDHPEERKRMGEHGRNWLASRSHPETVLTEWGDLLLEAAELGPVKSPSRRAVQPEANGFAEPSNLNLHAGSWVIMEEPR